MIFFCMDGDQMSPDLVEAVHEAFPRAAIYVRAYDRRALIRLKETPASAVVREVLESAVKMARIALHDAGLSEEAINRAEDMFRARDKERLRLQVEAGGRAGGTRQDHHRTVWLMTASRRGQARQTSAPDPVDCLAQNRALARSHRGG